MKKIAITGANGFLGAYLVKAFLTDGFEVIALIRKSANCEMLPQDDSLTIEQLDYQNDLDAQFTRLKDQYGTLTYFLHNAGVTVSLDNEEYFRINRGMTKSVLEALEKSDWLPETNKLIYISSMAAQGPFGVGKPVSNYGRSKLEAEKEIEKGTFPYLMFRPTGIYGAGDVAFLPLFKLASKGLYPLTSDKQKMSMIHARDLARLVVSESKDAEGIIHTNDGNTYLHQDFIEALQKVTGRKMRKIPTPTWISKLSLGLSDLWHNLIKKRPGLTLEKFQEISMDWHLHENTDLRFSKFPCEISLQEGFQDAYNFYTSKKLL